jgi:predicted small secreted protein
MKTTAAVLLTAVAVALPLAGCATDAGTTANASSGAPAEQANALRPGPLTEPDMTQPTSICPQRRQ